MMNRMHPLMGLPDIRFDLFEHGHVELIDMMGGDARVVQAARLSISGEGTRTVSSDEALIRYLLRHRHTTPFEQVVYTISMKMPIFVARQFVRHRTQALNELSGRYSVMPEEFYVPDEAAVRRQADTNKQGRSDSVLAAAEAHVVAFAGEATAAFGNYHQRVDQGMARELARINLPLSTYTQWWTTMSLHNLLHMLSLRDHPHAQDETAAYARCLAQIVEATCPVTYQAYVDFRKEALTLTRLDVEAIKQLADVGRVLAVHWPTKREFEEFKAKAEALGVHVAVRGGDDRPSGYELVGHAVHLLPGDQ